MHTVRNRVASRPRLPRASNNGKAPRSPSPRSAGKEPSFLLRPANPPAFPDHLILPTPRGAVIVSVPWPEAPKTGKPSGAKKAKPSAPKKPRKLAKGKGAAKKRSPSSTRKDLARKPANAVKRVRKKVASAAHAAELPPTSEVPAATTMIGLLDRALSIEPELPLVRVQPAATVATSEMAKADPLPRSQSLAPVRGSGLLEAIGEWLRSTAKALRFWRPSMRNDAIGRTRLVRANAHQHALQSQLEALEALQAPVSPPKA